MSIDPHGEYLDGKVAPEWTKTPAPGSAPEETGWDKGNPFVCPRPASLATTLVTIPGQGTQLVLTIHTETSTTTVMGDKATAARWWRQIKRDEEKMSASGLFTGG